MDPELEKFLENAGLAIIGFWAVCMFGKWLANRLVPGWQQHVRYGLHPRDGQSWGSDDPGGDGKGC